MREAVVVTVGAGLRESWQVPTATAALDATVTVPGSKSQTARLLVLAALADGPSRLTAPLHARDTELMAAALRTLGHGVASAGDDWVVTPGKPPSDPPPGVLEVAVGNSGTVTRFLPAVAALGSGDVRFDGDPRIRERPVGPLIDALRQLGVEIDDGGRGALPLNVHGHGSLPGGNTTLDASVSSQLVSGLLLAAPRSERGVEVHHEGPRIPSHPYLEMTVAELRKSGAHVEASADNTAWSIAPGVIRARDVDIEPDLSSAFPFLVAPLLAGGSVTMTGWPADSVQPGAIIPQLLEKLGAAVSFGPASITVTGTGGVHGIDADLGDFGEAVPVLVALALFAENPSRLRNIANLRTHETDRLLALSEEFGRLGADVRETADGLEIHPAGGLTGGTLDPREDHRLAMSYAVAGLRIPGITVLDVGTVAKTVPDFLLRWATMLGRD